MEHESLIQTALRLHEVIHCMMAFLDSKDLFQSGLVCRLWFEISHKNESFWQNHCQSLLDSFPKVIDPLKRTYPPLVLQCPSWKKQLLSMNEEHVVLGPFPLNVRVYPSMNSKTLTPLNAGTMVLPLIRVNDESGNTWLRHQTGWSMQEDVEAKNAATGNKFGRFFIAKKIKDTTLTNATPAGVYNQPSDTTKRTKILLFNTKISPVAVYKDKDGVEWLRIIEGWTKRKHWTEVEKTQDLSEDTL